MAVRRKPSADAAAAAAPRPRPRPSRANAKPPPAPVTDTATAADQPTLVLRVTRAIERELTEIEQIVGRPRTTAARRSEAERRARTLASLARTLAEIRKLRSAEEAEKIADEPIPRDLDELRRALSQRLEQMVETPAQRRAREHD